MTRPPLPGFVSTAAFWVGVGLALIGVGDLELGHQLGRELAVGFIERGAELAAGAAIFTAGGVMALRGR